MAPTHTCANYSLKRNSVTQFCNLICLIHSRVNIFTLKEQRRYAQPTKQCTATSRIRKNDNRHCNSPTVVFCRIFRLPSMIVCSRLMAAFRTLFCNHRKRDDGRSNPLVRRQSNPLVPTEMWAAAGRPCMQCIAQTYM